MRLFRNLINHITWSKEILSTQMTLLLIFFHVIKTVLKVFIVLKLSCGLREELPNILENTHSWIDDVKIHIFSFIRSYKVWFNSFDSLIFYKKFSSECSFILSWIFSMDREKFSPLFKPHKAFSYEFGFDFIRYNLTQWCHVSSHLFWAHQKWFVSLKYLFRNIVLLLLHD